MEVATTAAEESQMKQKYRPKLKNVMDKCIEMEQDGIFNHENLMAQLWLVRFLIVRTVTPYMF